MINFKSYWVTPSSHKEFLKDSQADGQEMPSTVASKDIN